MDASIMEERLLKIDSEIHRLLGELRHGHSRSNRAGTDRILKFAGCWDDLPEKEFNAFTEEIKQRRTQAFLGRGR